MGSSTKNVVFGIGPPRWQRSWLLAPREDSASCLFAPKPVGYSPMTTPRFVTLPEMRRAAHARLPRDVWNFGAGGAETETSRRRNRRSLDRLAIAQNILVDVRQIDLRTSLLGVPLSWPVAVAPMGGLVLFHPEGDVEMARGCGLGDTLQFERRHRLVGRGRREGRRRAEDVPALPPRRPWVGR